MSIDGSRIGVEVKQLPHHAGKIGGQLASFNRSEHAILPIESDFQAKRFASLTAHASAVVAVITGFDPRNRVASKVPHETAPIKRGRRREAGLGHPTTLARAARLYAGDMSSPEQVGITVVGSANMDVVFSTTRIPAPGETLLATSLAKYPGGKGLNQAIAAARAGVPTSFLGALGRDENGDALLETMTDAAMNVDHVRRVDEESGQAFIVVADSAENAIIVASGANATVSALSAQERIVVAASAVLLMQLELPLDVVVESAEIARRVGSIVILNAAPASALPANLIENLDYLIVNEHEACLLGESDDLNEASERLARRVPQLVVTLGQQGSALYERGALVASVPARKVSALDTTGAGDTYCGAFAAAIAEGASFTAAAEFATAAAALSVQTLGAVPSIPLRNRIDAMVLEGQ